MKLKNLMPEQTAAQLENWRREQVDSVPSLYRGVYRRAYSGSSRATGVHAFCLYCTGNMREEVRNCSSWKCPLWPYRPYQDDSPDAEERHASTAESREPTGDTLGDAPSQTVDSGMLERPTTG